VYASASRKFSLCTHQLLCRWYLITSARHRLIQRTSAFHRFFLYAAGAKRTGDAKSIVLATFAVFE
jgi:hypothetical protein